MTKELKEALKLVNEQCKQVTYKEYREKLRSQKLDKYISALKGEFQDIDFITLNYAYTQKNKKTPGSIGQYKHTELGKSEKQNALDVLYWFKRDIEMCIGHLENN